MKRWILLQAAVWALCLSAAPAVGFQASAATTDPETIVRRADRALANLKTLRTEFTQEVENPILEKTTVGRGTLVYQAPDRFRIAYSEPAGDVVVHDGRNVWIYLPSTQPDQVIRQPAAESSVRNPLTYLRDLRAEYTLRHAGVETVSGRSADRLILTPPLRKNGQAPFARIEVWVDRSAGLLRKVRTQAADGVTTTYTFRDIEPGVTLAGSLFRFEAPPGVEVFDE